MMTVHSRGVRAALKRGDVVHLRRGSIVGVNEGKPGDTVMAGTELVEEHIRLETPELVKLYSEALAFEIAEARCNAAIRRLTEKALAAALRDPDVMGFVLGPLGSISEDAAIEYVYALLADTVRAAKRKDAA